MCQLCVDLSPFSPVVYAFDIGLFTLPTRVILLHLSHPLRLYCSLYCKLVPKSATLTCATDDITTCELPSAEATCSKAKVRTATNTIRIHLHDKLDGPLLLVYRNGFCFRVDLESREDGKGTEGVGMMQVEVRIL